MQALDTTGDAARQAWARARTWQAEGWLPPLNPFTLCAIGTGSAGALWLTGRRRAALLVVEALSFGSLGILWNEWTQGTRDLRFAVRHAWLPALVAAMRLRR